MIRKYKVEVLTEVEVTIDDSIIDDEFNEVFSRHFWQADCLEDHAKYLAEMQAIGRIQYDRFVEGYGDINDCGITIKEGDTYIYDCDEEKD